MSHTYWFYYYQLIKLYQIQNFNTKRHWLLPMPALSFEEHPENRKSQQFLKHWTRTVCKRESL